MFDFKNNVFLFYEGANVLQINFASFGLVLTGRLITVFNSLFLLEIGLFLEFLALILYFAVHMLVVLLHSYFELNWVECDFFRHIILQDFLPKLDIFAILQHWLVIG